MEPISATIFIEKILIDYLPEQRELIKKVFNENNLGECIEEIISNISSLLNPQNKVKQSPRTIVAYSLKALRSINERVGTISDPVHKEYVKENVAHFFNAVISEIVQKNKDIKQQIFESVKEGLELAAITEGYDEDDIFGRIQLNSFTLPKEISQVLKQSDPKIIQPTQFTTNLNNKELKYLGELLQQYGITRRKDQFVNLFCNGGKEITPVICTTHKQLDFIHFMYQLTAKYKWISIQNATLWEGIKESFVDQEKKFFDKKLKQFFHREMKKERIKSLIFKSFEEIINDFKIKFRTGDGPG